MTDPRRRFNRREKSALYQMADGRCDLCGAPLGPGWHADHVTPHSRTGKTALINGQALCADCNQEKGARVDLFTPEDTVKLRPFQEDLARVIGDRIAAGHPNTVGWVNAGSGKTLGWMHAANDLYRRGLIDGVIGLAPRLTLRKQAELDWTRPPGSLGKGDPGGFWHAYGEPKMGKIVARDNSHGRDGVSGAIRSITEARHFGYVTTYSSLVTDPGIHLSWARDHAKRFVLVCDEAQFLGADDEEGGGTQAARQVTALAEYALHTVMLTGTPNRSDGSRLVGCGYTDKDESGVRRLEWHVRATYRQGVAAGYLRDFQADLAHGHGRFSDGDEFDLATLEEKLGVVLSDPRVWHGLVDSTVARLRDVRRLDRRYQALICASHQDHAEEVMAYLTQRHPDLAPVLAISRQSGKDAQSALDGFRAGQGDVLVTVSKAYIGYDCKQITVVGLLTSRRWGGWLEQTVARGLRVWDERPLREQTCYVVGPADPRLIKFCEDMRADAEGGIRDRGPDGPGPGPGPFCDDAVLVDGFTATGYATKGMDVDADLTPADYEVVRAAREEGGLFDGEARLGWFLRKFGHSFTGVAQATPEPVGPPETEEEQRNRLSNDCKRLAVRFVHQNWPGLDRDEFRKQIAMVTADVNDRQGLLKGQIKNASVDTLLQRRQILLSWINNTQGVAAP